MKASIEKVAMRKLSSSDIFTVEFRAYKQSPLKIRSIKLIRDSVLNNKFEEQSLSVVNLLIKNTNIKARSMGFLKEVSIKKYEGVQTLGKNYLISDGNNMLRIMISSSHLSENDLEQILELGLEIDRSAQVISSQGNSNLSRLPHRR